ncbi:geranylgeranyl reductase family protein [Streptomyces sp. NPDC054887]
MTALQVRDAADVVVVGAGPAGSAAAYYLAQTGLDVLLVEKATFPRDKTCGDGLTPRAVKELVAMGIDVSPAQPGWVRTKGLRAYGGGLRVEIPWPELASFPDFGLVRTRMDLDHLLALRAASVGVRLLEGTKVTGPVLDERTGRIRGVVARCGDRSREIDARVVVAADGASSRMAVAMGLPQRKDRPVGVAVRRYYTTPRHDDDYLEAWVDLWAPDARGRRQMLPGYGWIFPLGDGSSNVGVGTFGVDLPFDVDYRALLRDWTARLPEDWRIGEEHAAGPVRGAALPAGLTRPAQYTRGMLLTGDAGGTINPLSGDGIDYAMESGRLAADVIAQALARPSAAQRERALGAYSRVLHGAVGSYFTLGRFIVHALGNPHVMRFIAKNSLPNPTVRRLMFKLWANLADPHGKDSLDRVISVLLKATPAG